MLTTNTLHARSEWFSTENTGQWLAHFLEHEREIAKLVAYLAYRSQEGFTAAQFEIYRLNYFLRIDMTVRGIARIASLAADPDNNDWQALRCIAQNLYEECGEEGGRKQNHRDLLEASHNLHGQQIFALPRWTIAESVTSDQTLQATRDFITSRRAAFFDSPYVTALAASFAQEIVATPMLSIFFNTLFRPYEPSYVNKAEWELVSRYFDVHLNGVEQNHGKMALECLTRQVQKSCATDEAKTAIHTFLDSQAKLWGELHEALVAAESVGEVIRVPK